MHNSNLMNSKFLKIAHLVLLVTAWVFKIHTLYYISFRNKELVITASIQFFLITVLVTNLSGGY